MARVESSSRGFERQRDSKHDKSSDPRKDRAPPLRGLLGSPPRQAPKSFPALGRDGARRFGDRRLGRCAVKAPAPRSVGDRLTQQPVTGAAHGCDTVGADLVAQVADVDVHHVG